MFDDSDEEETNFVGMGDLESEEEEEEKEEDLEDDENEATQPEWLRAFRSQQFNPQEVAEAWLSTLTAEERTAADEDPHTSRSNFRENLLGRKCKEVRQDKTASWKRTGLVMRALDETLGVALGRKRQYKDDEPKQIFAGANGKPGTLGLWWSAKGPALSPEAMTELGVTHRLNCAEDLMHHFDSELMPTAHIPMEDFFSTSEHAENDRAKAVWMTQMPMILTALRQMRDEGAVVNVNCRMGKNRSGVAILLWMCCEEGWALVAAVNHLRRMNYLALANPVLLAAAADFIGFEGQLPMLCPEETDDGNESGWIAISPPPSPR